MTKEEIFNDNGWVKADVIVAMRREISLGSIFYADYNNSFELDTDEVYNFFEWYNSYLVHLAEEDGIYEKDYDYNDPKRSDLYSKLVSSYDTEENLRNFYAYECSESNPFSVELWEAQHQEELEEEPIELYY
jgi:hypothetical protein